MRMPYRTVLALGVVAAVAAASPAADKTATFDDDASLKGWLLTGPAAVDKAKGRAGSGGALKLGPGAKAVWKLRDANDSGRLELWAY